MSTWTTIPDPASGGTINIQVGEPIGLLLALTYATASVVPSNSWTFINNPTASSWTTISNPI